jgi:hypothetical protein
MEKNYETKHMYKVFIFNGKKFEDVLFENKLTAQAYVSYLKENGHECGMNVWLWEVKIEK